MSTDLVDTGEMYLKAVYELEEEGIRPIRARLVERLEQSKPTVSETVGRLERQGLVVLDESNTIRLTHAGRRTATAVMRKHRLAERLLLDVIGLPWDQVHDEACRWEHVMSRQVTERLDDLIDATLDPYGNPIPEAVEGPGEQSAVTSGVVSVAAFLTKRPEGGEVELARIGEVLQTDGKLLRSLSGAAVLPGVRVRVTPGDDGASIARVDGAGSEGKAVALPPSALAHLFVATLL